VFNMDDNETPESKPTKRRDFTKRDRKNRKDGPKAPRHNRKEKYRPNWLDNQDYIDGLLDDVLGED